MKHIYIDDIQHLEERTYRINEKERKSYSVEIEALKSFGKEKAYLLTYRIYNLSYHLDGIESEEIVKQQYYFDEEEAHKQFMRDTSRCYDGLSYKECTYEYVQ